MKNIENKNSGKIKEIKIPMKFNPATQKYETDFEKLDEKVKKIYDKNGTTNRNKNREQIRE